MGVTTEGVGQCGGSIYPVNDNNRADVKQRLRRSTAPPPEIDWSTLQEWRERVEDSGTGVNLVPYVGHNTLRHVVMGGEGEGGEKYVPADDELEELKQLAAEAMEQGAFGMSTGLRYPLGRNATTDEVVELARVVGQYGGLHISHMRSEADALIAAVEETIEITRRAELPGCITHHKAMFRENWGKVSETMRMVTMAHEEGLPMFIDFYPWNHARETNLGSWFVGYLLSGGGADEEPPGLGELVNRVADDQQWAEIRESVKSSYEQQLEANEKRRKALLEYGVKVPDIWNPAEFDYIVHSANHPELVGKCFREVAEALGMDDYWEAVRRVFLEDEGETFVAGGTMREEDLVTILRHPAAAISTDGWTTDGRPDNMDVGLAAVHPRSFGTYPKVLQKYVREEGVLTLPEAIRRMTSLPATILGLQKRGVLRPGAWADIVVLDYDNVECTATFSNPAQYPKGIEYVLVNGEVAVENGSRTEVTAGRVLRRK
jgi:N-acyl-D-aspartate/D-glutamate deacylase